MAEHDFAALSGEIVVQSFPDINRAVLAARAAYRDSEIAAPIGLEARYPAFKEAGQILNHLRYLGGFLQEASDLGIAASLGAEMGLPMGIRQTTDIDYEIHVPGHALFV